MYVPPRLSGKLVCVDQRCRSKNYTFGLPWWMAANTLAESKCRQAVAWASSLCHAAGEPNLVGEPELAGDDILDK